MPRRDVPDFVLDFDIRFSPVDDHDLKIGLDPRTAITSRLIDHISECDLLGLSDSIVFRYVFDSFSHGERSQSVLY